ncbi:hypothetical protein C4579_02885 [Candidatus Microgenomates bacterium]|nr:MAG: hypothetical protein C4579_02885 [Candidatus Microgenomates bacterium]
MNKDTIVASVIGFGLGLIAAIALWIVPRVLHKQPTTVTAAPETNQEIALNNAPATQNTLTVTSPSDGEIVNEKALTISGNAQDALFVVVTTDSVNDVMELDNGGTFSTEVTLHEGSNEIAVTRYTASGEETKRMFVYYYEEII